MARKKKPLQNKDKDFSNSPFKDLKGLSALKCSDNPSRQPDARLNEPSPRESKKAKDVSFASEMDFLGVKPLMGKVQDGPAGTVNPSRTLSVKPTVENDQDEFLNALGSMDKVFKDEWPDGQPENKAQPRRIKQLARGQLKIQGQLDLHGCTVDEAREKVEFYLRNSIYHELSCVLIITGKGLHSSGAPVLGLAVETLLGLLSSLVIEWGRAPRRYGGSGAYVVFLRRKEKK